MQNNNAKLKTFNWMLLLLVFSFAFYVPVISRAAVSQLSFTTEPQTILPNTISDKLTVSSGDAPGETSDLALTSSSASGEFLNESGEAFRPTWNSNYKSRTFYYRDSTAGVYTITATLTTRTSQQSWSATQTITVGDGAQGNGDDDTNATTTTPTSLTTPTGNASLSAHASPAPVGEVTAPETFKVGAGRPRLASVHSPIIFRAESSGSISKNVRYQWSFGDGGSAVGEQVTHFYHFPGEYNVVLDASSRDGTEAVARTNVSVIQPVISFGSFQPDRVEIINRSPREVNLGGWRIMQGATTFTFPADTIVTAGKGTTVPAVFLGFSPMPSVPVTLTFPDATVALVSSAPVPNQESLAVMAESLRQLSAKLAAIKATRQ